MADCGNVDMIHILTTSDVQHEDFIKGELTDINEDGDDDKKDEVTPEEVMLANTLH